MNLNKDYRPGVNFWEVNPQMTKMGPFADIWRLDKSRGKEKSSDQAWGILLYAETSETSQFFGLPEDEKKEIIEKNFGVDFKSRRTEKCIEFYEEHGMTKTERLLIDYGKILEKRTEFLMNVEYNSAEIERIDRSLAQTGKIWEGNEKILEKFKEEQGSIHISGGRKRSAIEDGSI